MLKVTNIAFHEKSESTIQTGRYIADTNEAIIGRARRYEDPAGGIRALMVLS